MRVLYQIVLCSFAGRHVLCAVINVLGIKSMFTLKLLEEFFVICLLHQPSMLLALLEIINEAAENLFLVLLQTHPVAQPKRQPICCHIVTFQAVEKVS